MSRATLITIAGGLFFLAFIWVPPMLGFWEYSLSVKVYYVMVSLMAVGVILIALIAIWGERDKKEQAIRDKISELKKKNFALHSEQVQSLSGKDLSSLRVYKIIVLSIAGGFGLVAIAVISIMSMNNLLKLTAGGVTVATCLALVLALNKRMNLMFAEGEKTIVRGLITNKNTGVDDDNDKAYHWLYIGERKVKVEIALYSLYEIGNMVEFHLYERFGTFILHHEKLEGVGIEA